MKIALPIVCIFFGFVGIMIDGYLSPEQPLFTFVLFLLPLIWAVGVLYDELPAMISDYNPADSNKTQDNDSNESQDEYKEKYNQQIEETLK